MLCVVPALKCERCGDKLVRHAFHVPGQPLHAHTFCPCCDRRRERWYACMERQFPLCSTVDCGEPAEPGSRYCLQCRDEIAALQELSMSLYRPCVRCGVPLRSRARDAECWRCRRASDSVFALLMRAALVGAVAWLGAPWIVTHFGRYIIEPPPGLCLGLLAVCLIGAVVAWRRTRSA